VGRGSGGTNGVGTSDASSDVGSPPEPDAGATGPLADVDTAVDATGNADAAVDAAADATVGGGDDAGSPDATPLPTPVTPIPIGTQLSFNVTTIGGSTISTDVFTVTMP
jgi:hypothetical protein